MRGVACRSVGEHGFPSSDPAPPMTPHETAQLRIDACRQSRAEKLTLMNLKLGSVPDEVFELTWLAVLARVSGDDQHAGLVADPQLNPLDPAFHVEFPASAKMPSNAASAK